MTTPRNTAAETNETYASTYAEERWQGPSFAASWIAPPAPHRYGEDPTAPQREDDHA